MINVVYGGDEAFDAIVYGQQNPANLNYFQSQLNNVSQTLTNIGQQFFSNANEIYERFNGAEALRLIKAATRATVSLFTPDKITTLHGIGQFQQAPLTMQRWVMANPEVRTMYHAQRLDGYADTYVDVQPGKIGENHYDFRRVMDGVVTDDEEDTSFVKFYIDELEEGDAPLTHEDKVDILNTWDIVNMFLRAGKEDPTSPYNTSL